MLAESSTTLWPCFPWFLAYWILQYGIGFGIGFSMGIGIAMAFGDGFLWWDNKNRGGSTNLRGWGSVHGLQLTLLWPCHSRKRPALLWEGHSFQKERQKEGERSKKEEKRSWVTHEVALSSSSM